MNDLIQALKEDIVNLTNSFFLELYFDISNDKKAITIK